MCDSPLLLAYLGDAVMEVLVRRHLIGIGKSNAECNKLALEYVTAARQSAAIRGHLDLLTPEEKELFTRSKNEKSANHPRNTDLYSYRLATGLEAVFGYNHLLGKHERNEELFRLLFLSREEKI